MRHLSRNVPNARDLHENVPHDSFAVLALLRPLPPDLSGQSLLKKFSAQLAMLISRAEQDVRRANEQAQIA